MALLKSLHTLTGHGRYVFPGERSHDRPISDNSLRTALYALGFGKEQIWHGFRATARTMLVDQLNLVPLLIEANLAVKFRPFINTFDKKLRRFISPIL